MRWFGKGSGNIEDRRSGGGGKFALGGGAAIIAVIIGLITGQNPLELLNQVGSSSVPQETVAEGTPTDAEGKFVAGVLESTEIVWNKELGSDYREPTLVLFRGQVQSACGSASSAVGPFYCPGDEKVY